MQGLLPSPSDVRLADLARRQHGVVSTEQLRAAGLGSGAVEHRVRSGWLHRVHRGVYAVGHARLDGHGHLWAAVLACGGPGRAALSHRSAASLWDLLPPWSGPIEVTTLRGSRSTQAICVHDSRTLDPAAEITDVDGLPVTTVSRTLIDLADVLTLHQLTRVCHRAEHLRLLDVANLQPGPGRRSRALQAALATLAHAEPAVTRNDFEEAMLSLVDRFGLPVPEVNTRVLTHEVDFLWREQRLIAETDGRATHLTPTGFEADRERDAQLMVAGYRVVRFTWRQLTERPAYVAATLRQLLAAKRRSTSALSSSSVVSIT